jgi:hypothetical protein
MTADMARGMARFIQHLNRGTCSVVDFRSPYKPSVQLDEYLSHLLIRTNSDLSVAILTMVYLNRFIQMTGVQLDACSEHRLACAAFVTAHIWHEDESMSRYSRTCSIHPIQLEVIMRLFLRGLRWTLFVDENEFNMYKDAVMSLYVAEVPRPCEIEMTVLRRV